MRVTHGATLLQPTAVRPTQAGLMDLSALTALLTLMAAITTRFCRATVGVNAPLNRKVARSSAPTQVEACERGYDCVDREAAR